MVTVFTPTYNRRRLLPRLYESLCKQEYADFEWVVVDDGSTDETEDLIRTYIEESTFPIVYLYQKNSGKHIAHNTGVLNSRGEFFFCVDSDDQLKDSHTLSELVSDWEKHCNCDAIAGMISYKSDMNGNLLGKAFPESIQYATSVELVARYHSHGERTVIYKTELLRQNPYPSFEGEKFCPDSYISDRLSCRYKFFLRRVIDEVCEYQSDGLSRSFLQLMANNPKSFALCNMQLVDLEPTFFMRLKRCIYYMGFNFLSLDKSIKYSGKHKLIVILAYVPGIILSLYYRYYRLRRIRGAAF